MWFSIKNKKKKSKSNNQQYITIHYIQIIQAFIIILNKLLKIFIIGNIYYN